MDRSKGPIAHDFKIKIPCERHSNKKLEYICLNPNCKDKLFCSSCLFKKEYCRHDDHLRDLNEFLQEQSNQFKMRGLLCSKDIFDHFQNKDKYMNQYEGKVNQQIQVIEDEFEKLHNALTVILEDAKDSIIKHLKSYEDTFERQYQRFDATVSNNYLSKFFISKFKNYEDMLNNFSPFTEESLRSMVEPIIENYMEQFEVPTELKDAHESVTQMLEQPPVFDVDRYDKVKNYLFVFRDKMNQALTTLINIGDDKPLEDSPNKVMRLKGPNSVTPSPGLEKGRISSQSGVTLPTINQSRLYTQKMDTGDIYLGTNNFGRTGSLNSSPIMANNRKANNRSITSVIRKDINISKIHYSAAWDTEHTRTVFSVLYLGNRLAATASDDGKIKIWDIVTFQPIKELTGHTAGVRSLAQLNNGNLVSASWDKTLRVWDTGNLTFMTDVEREKDGQNMSFVSSGNRSMNLGSERKTTADSCLRVLSGHVNAVLCCAILPDGKTIISGSTDYSIKVWDSSSGVCYKTMTGHQSEVLCVTSTKTTNLILSGSGDKTIRIWNNDKKFNNACIKTLSGHMGFVWSIVVLNDDQTLVSGSLDKLIKVWNLMSGECIKNVNGHFNQVLCLRLYKDDMVVSSDAEGTIKIWNVNKGWQQLNSLKKGDGKTAVYGLDVTEDYMILSSGVDRKLVVWN